MALLNLRVSLCGIKAARAVLEMNATLIFIPPARSGTGATF
ncbi:hypothetical protein BCO26_1102 [Heyndrickxia coagulans 2-6]|nr:hypothetical protein BCO26_1102 [Heyndrickxia coagulans 2-6]